MRLAERALRGPEEASLAAHIQQSLGHPFRLAFVYFDDAITWGPGGKFEGFICRLAP